MVKLKIKQGTPTGRPTKLHAVIQISWKRFALAGLLLALVATLVGCGGGAATSSNIWSPPPKPEVPVVISSRSAVLGNGEVAIFSNQTGNRLTITVKIEDKTGSNRKTGTLDLDPNGKAEIGWMEGWRFKSGDTIEISHPDYSPKTTRFP